MSNADERRWQQRLDNFGTALAQLTSACERDRYDDLERAGLIKTFEFASSCRGTSSRTCSTTKGTK